MKAKFFIYFILSLSSIITINAQQVSLNDARKAALNFYSYMLTEDNKHQNNIASASETIISDQGSTLMYAINISNSGGFVIVSADMRSNPVLCYSAEGYFNNDETQWPDGFRWLMNHYRKQLTLLQNNPSQVSSAPHPHWALFLNNTFPEKAPAISPLLTAKWNQGCYYNNNCPPDITGQCGRVLTGCQATAMGQLMKYWNFPTQGQSSHSYNHPAYGLQSVTFSSTYYDWTNMPDYLDASSNTTQKNAVGTLLYHCGVAVDMNYGPSASSANFITARNALVNYFKYSSSAVHRDKSLYTDTDWMNMLRSDLDQNMPVLYRGEDSISGGHVFVCDGYQGAGNDYFHMNWGWGGSYDCYCYINHLVPGTSGYDFTDGQFAIFQIFPPCTNPVPSFVANLTTGTAPLGVTFTDNSYTQTGTITSRYWQFGDGQTTYTSNTTVPHTYDHSGVYSVSLTLTNSCGGVFTGTNVAYINVDGPLGCDTSSNIVPTDTIYGYIFDPSCPGYWTSQNCNGWSKFADKISGSGHNIIYGIKWAVISAKYASTASTIKLKIWADGMIPGAELYSQTLNINSFNTGQWKNIPLDTPLIVNTGFYVGYEVNYVPGDTFGLFCKKIMPFGNTAYVYTNYGWQQYSQVNSVFNSSLALYVERCNITEKPEADFVADTTNPLVSHTVTFTNLSTDYPFEYEWKLSPSTGYNFTGGTYFKSVNPKIRFNNTGTYSITLIAKNPVGNDTMTKTNYITVVNNTGIATYDDNRKINIYPVPASDFLNVDLTEQGDDIVMLISDQSGKTCREYRFSNAGTSHFELPVSNLAAGIYYLKINNNGNISNYKFSVFKE